MRAVQGVAATGLLAELEANGIASCVIGSSRTDPDGSGRDVDIVVRREDAGAAGRLLWELGTRRGGRVVGATRACGGGFQLRLAWLEGGRPASVVRFDVHVAISFQGRAVLEAKEILETRLARPARGRPDERYHVASPGVELIHVLLKGADRGALSTDDSKRLGGAWKEGSNEFRARAIRLWPAGLVERAAGALERGDFEQVTALLPRLARAVGTSPISRGLRKAWEAVRRLKDRTLRPGGWTVAFLGIDGGGKSSVIRRLNALLEPAFPRARYFHFKPNLLGRRPMPSTKAVVYPAGIARGASLVGALRLAHYLVDFSIGYLFKVWTQRVRSALVIFARYFHDLWIDPIRRRARIPMSMARAFAPFVPKPDMILVIDTPPETARARKLNGVPPLEEAARQRAAYLALARKLPNAVVLDGSRGAEDVADEAARLVLDRLGERTADRMGWRREGVPESADPPVFPRESKVHGTV